MDVWVNPLHVGSSRGVLDQAVTLCLLVQAAALVTTLYGSFRANLAQAMARAMLAHMVVRSGRQTL